LQAAAQVCQDGRSMTPRRLLLLAAIVGCTPEPASTQEILQTIHELVDQGRAIAIENAVVTIATNVDPDGDPEDLRDDVVATITRDVACAVATPGAAPEDLEIDFGDGCVAYGRSYAGRLLVTIERPAAPGKPDGDTLLVTLGLKELTSEGTTLSGTTRVTWGVDNTRRVISELRLDSAAPDSDAPGRQIEIQSDRIQRMYKGALQVDGWHRWQTLMGKWKAEIGGWELGPGGLMPERGLTSVDTPFEHDVFVDHAVAGDGAIEVRANGGRRDRVFMVAADGTITDLGDG
jgi:hypothetical protein